MSLAPTFLLVAATLLTTAGGQQSSELFRDGSSFAEAPKFRDASEFPSGPAAQDPVYTPLQDLPSYQQGYQIINPQYANLQQSAGAKKISDSDRQTVRRQEEYLKSVLGDNESRGSQHVFRTTTVFPPTLNLFNDDQTNVNKFRAPSSKGFGHSPSIHSPAAPHTSLELPEIFSSVNTDHRDFIHPDVNAFSQLQADKPFGIAHDFDFTRNAEFGAVERKPVKPPQRNSFGRVDSVQAPRRPILRTGIDRNANGNGFREQSQFTSNIRLDGRTSGSTPKPQPPPLPVSSEIFPTIQDESVTVQDFSPVTPAPSKINSFSGDAGDDEESQFISQVNRNTAAFVSGNKSFREEFGGKGAGVPSTTSFLAQELVIPSRTESRTSTFGVDQQLSTQNKLRRKGIGNRQRNQNTAPFDDIFFTTPATVNRNHAPVSTRFQDENDQDSQINTELEAKKQAESANYEFSSAVSDTINDNSQIRKEVRNGLKLSGLYSYSDGFFKRTVYYEADENGYRVVKEESEPIGRGPQYNPNGEVEVNSQQSGNVVNYKVRGDQLSKLRKPLSHRELPLSIDELPTS